MRRASTLRDRGELRRFERRTTSSMTKLTSRGWFTTSVKSPPVSLLDRGKRGAATTYPARAQVPMRSVSLPGLPLRPWASTMSGRRPRAPDGNVIVVSNVRDGSAGSAPLAGVGRVVSTNVSWIVVTDGGAAATAPGDPTPSANVVRAASITTARCRLGMTRS
jgi:hypothetical protein